MQQALNISHGSHAELAYWYWSTLKIIKYQPIVTLTLLHFLCGQDNTYYTVPATMASPLIFVRDCANAASEPLGRCHYLRQGGGANPKIVCTQNPPPSERVNYELRFRPSSDPMY